MARGWWNAKRELAAGLLAVGEKSKEEIAEHVGIGRTTLYRWIEVQEFVDRVEELRAKVRDEVRTRTLTTGIADKVERIGGYQKRWELMQAIALKRLERGLEIVSGVSADVPAIFSDIDDDPEIDEDGKEHVPGPDGHGKKGKADELIVDGGLLRELRQLEKQVAIEVGDWEEPGIGGIEKTYVNVDIDRV